MSGSKSDSGQLEAVGDGRPQDSLVRLQGALRDLSLTAGSGAGSGVAGSPSVSRFDREVERAMFIRLSTQLDVAASELASRDAEIQRLRAALDEVHLQLRRQSSLNYGSAGAASGGSMSSPRTPRSTRADSPDRGMAGDGEAATAERTIAQLQRRVELLEQQQRRSEKAHAQQVAQLENAIHQAVMERQLVARQLQAAEALLAGSTPVTVPDAAAVGSAAAAAVAAAASRQSPAPSSPRSTGVPAAELERRVQQLQHQYSMLQDQVVVLRERNDQLEAERIELQATEATLRSQLAATREAYAQRVADLERRLAEKERRLLALVGGSPRALHKVFSP